MPTNIRKRFEDPSHVGEEMVKIHEFQQRIQETTRERAVSTITFDWNNRLSC